ncbi:hypothetical protein [Paenarthrobacter sp. YJN-5]|uniref:hypothetical protein n=1 Tax=Paenarthrobacter sp. YJN-5 TaxID=2735316 RepID=UPI001878BB9B|nr:hypothetical protein [Paenarthrobacter sp. YJN-5]QOT19225.1 hypothetical protein HMI59_21165 [Paenarthrobacter sp. YJN-5]
MICQTCIQTNDALALRALEQSVLAQPGLRQIVEALSTAGGLTSQGFDRYRDLGVKFETFHPWDEVENLYRKYPIEIPDTQYYLWVRRTSTFGSRATRHHIGAVPGLPIAISNSEGYTIASGLVTSRGKVLKPAPSGSSNKHMLTSDWSKEDWTGSGVGFNFLGALQAVSRWKSVTEAYIREDPSVCYSKEESKKFLGPIFGVWRQYARGIHIP